MLEIGIGIVVGLWWASHRLKKVQAEMSVTALQAALEGRWAYWLEDGHLVRAPMLAGIADLDAIEVIDPFNCEDLSPVEVVEILDVLEGGRSSR